MATPADESNISRDLSDEHSAPNDEKRDWDFVLFLGLGVVALLLPHLSIVFADIYWAAVVAVVVLIAWVIVMPVTCMSGGFISSLVAVVICLNTLGVLLAAAIRLTISVLT